MRLENRHIADERRPLTTISFIQPLVDGVQYLGFLEKRMRGVDLTVDHLVDHPRLFIEVLIYRFLSALEMSCIPVMSARYSTGI